jgi:hypothetical protein
MKLPRTSFPVLSLGLGVMIAAMAADTPLRAGDLCVAERVAAATGWTLEWIVQLPFDADRARLESVSIGDGLVVATTGDGRVHAYRESPDPLAGTLAWSQRLGHAAEPGLPADVGHSLVLATRGSNVFAFDRESGDRIWADRLGHMPNASAIEGDNWVFVPYGPLRLLRLPAYPQGRPAAVRASTAAGSRAATADAAPASATQEARGNSATVTSSATAKDKATPADRARKRADLEGTATLLIEAGTATAKSLHRLGVGSIGWVGDEGMLVTLNDLENGWKRHELRLGGLAAGDLIHRDEKIFLSLSSGDLVRVDSDPSAGLTTFWRVALPSIPSGDLLVDGDTLVVSLGVNGLEGRSVSTGDLLWKSDTPAHLVAAGNGMGWWFDQVGRLVLADLTTGLPLAKVCVGRFQVPIRNTDSGRLYLATTDGVLASLASPMAVAEAASTTSPVDEAPQQPRDADSPAEDGAAPGDEPPIEEEPFEDDPFTTRPPRRGRSAA